MDHSPRNPYFRNPNDVLRFLLSMSKFNELINGNQPVLVDFYADWCQPCKMMAPILEEAKSELGNSVRIIKVDTDKNQQVSMKYGIRGIPTLILFQNGQIKWRQSGVVPKDMIVQNIKNSVEI